MSAVRKTQECYPTAFNFGPLKGEAPAHNHSACPGGQHTPGVIGGWHCPCPCHQKPPSPSTLWYQADREHPDNEVARRDRYRELMREHGHLVDAKPGEDRNSPCGWDGTET